MLTAITGVAGFALGLYSGLKRAKNYSWCEIIRDFWNDSERIVRAIWKHLSKTFRSDGQGPTSGSLAMA